MHTVVTKPADGMLETQDFLSACDAAGLEVSESQAQRWRREGLLPPASERSGRGQGRGREPAYWEAACVNRCRVILASLHTDPRSLDRAAEALFTNGYWVWEGRVRDYFETIADLLDQTISKRRTFLKDGTDPDDAVDCLVRSVKGKNREVSPQFLTMMEESVIGLVGLRDHAALSPYTDLAAFFSPISLRKAIGGLSDDQLETIQKNAKGWVRNFMVMADIIVFGRLALDPTKSPSNLEGPSLQFTGIKPIKAFQTGTSVIEISDAQLRLQMVGLMMNVVLEVYDKKFKGAVFKALLQYIRKVVWQDATGLYRKALGTLMRQLETHVSKDSH